MPGATIFKPGHLVGTEDRLYNNFAQLAKVPALAAGFPAKERLPQHARAVRDDAVGAQAS